MKSIETGSDVSVMPLQQVVQATGSESPSTLSWNSKIHRARQDPSRTRLKAIESYLENGHTWVPPSPSHRKTWEEEVDIHTHIVIYYSLSSAYYILRRD